MIWGETSLGENTQTEKSFDCNDSSAIFQLHFEIFWPSLSVSQISIYRDGIWTDIFDNMLSARRKLTLISVICTGKNSRGENIQTETLINKFKKYKHDLLGKCIWKVVWYSVQTLLWKAYFVVTWFISSWPVSAPLAAVSVNNEIPQPSVSCSGGKTSLGENFQIYWEVIRLQ